MRGKVIPMPSSSGMSWITPAYAGKSRFAHYGERGERDHPRLCGEKSEPENCDMNNQGSPPPMRGKALKTMPKQKRCRITPAYAGKSVQHVIIWLINRDHPRLCGEKPIIQVNIIYLIGSPPPMRGKELLKRRDVQEYRITPAYAGKSVAA